MSPQDYIAARCVAGPTLVSPFRLLVLDYARASGRARTAGPKEFAEALASADGVRLVRTPRGLAAYGLARFILDRTE